ncbi:DsbC family protein [Mariprofundus ferrooxydans]|nr:DsbC family protein [Mariprofundus ferrooxydans]KON48342.1 protein-disulfide isomerase [Mariprofundus ferrooxydans]
MRSLLLILSCLIALPAMATEANIESIRSHAADVLRNTPIDAVTPSPIPGLFEVKSGRNIFYTDADGSHFVIGAHIIDSVAKKDLTRARLEELNRVEWSVLPLDKAIVSGDKNGKLKLAVFTDPECPYCRKFEKELAKVKGVKVYSFLYPLSFHKHAKRWSTAIWCSKDRQKMMTDIMVNNADPAAGTCDTPIDEIAALGKKLGITGTPTLISGDGRLSPGGKDAPQLKAWLQEASAGTH